MKRIVVGIVCALAAPLLAAQMAPPVRRGVVSDWTSRHVLYPDSQDYFAMARVVRDPRWLHDWYLRHPGVRWQRPNRELHNRNHRDWSVPLGTTYFEPVFDSTFAFTIGTETGLGSLNLISQGAGTYLATAGTVTVTGAQDIGTYSLLPGGPAITTSPNGAFLYDNLVFPSQNPPLDVDALLFDNGGGLELNMWGNSAGNYSFYTGTGSGNYPIQIVANGSFTANVDSNPGPGGGQTFPAKYVFDVDAAPSCASDFVVMGLPTAPVSGGQANIVGVNNLYSGGAGAFCSTGPTVKFAYASGAGQVPASVVLSQNGSQIAYIENLGGSSYFHVLTLGTTGNNGASTTAAVLPGSGNNALDQRVLLSPDLGVTSQGSTTAPWVVYTAGDANDVAYATTYSSAGTGSGYLYKINNVFNGGAPAIVWSVPITAIPSAPVYDQVSNKIFFTDSNGRIDYVIDSGSPPSVFYGPAVASGTTSENPVIVDSTRQMVYATFNSNGSNSLVVQAPTSLASTVTATVGTASTVNTAP
jgi:hypothetical protein